MQKIAGKLEKTTESPKMKRKTAKFCAFALILSLGALTGCHRQYQQQYDAPAALVTSRTAQYHLGDADFVPLEKLIARAGHWEEPRSGPAKTEHKPSVPAPLPEKHWGKVVHKVMPGQSLYALARFYTNEEKHWQAIARANPQAIDANNHLRIGTELFIDADIVVNVDAIKLYVARPGDSWPAIARRFRAAANIGQINNQPYPIPGTIIKIR
jgi:nucleoid-associated protein YgaU